MQLVGVGLRVCTVLIHQQSGAYLLFRSPQGEKHCTGKPPDATAPKSQIKTFPHLKKVLKLLEYNNDTVSPI